MMSTSAGSRPNPIILMVPGAWHTPAAFDLLIPALAEHNYNALAVSLPSVDVSPGLPDFSEDVAAIRTAVEQHLDEKNRDVVLLMHSYGAIPGTEALRGLGKEERTAVGKKTGVVALVYVAAVVPAVGGTCFSASTDLTEEEKANQSRMRLVDNGDGTSSVENPVETFYQDVNPELAQDMVKSIKTHSISTMKQPLMYEAYRHIPAAYLLCEHDNAISLPKQKRLATAAGVRVQEQLASGHSPFLNKPNDVADFVVRAVEQLG